MELAGIERRADVVVANFLALPFLLAGTQRVCVLQQRLARTLQSSGNIRVLDLPAAIPPLVESLWWHPPGPPTPATGGCSSCSGTPRRHSASWERSSSGGRECSADGRGPCRFRGTLLSPVEQRERLVLARRTERLVPGAGSVDRRTADGRGGTVDLRARWKAYLVGAV